MPAIFLPGDNFQKGDAGMTKRQQRFCDEYLKDTNATQAASRAGYSKKSAYSVGQRLLKNVEVKNYLEARMKEIQDKTIADATEVVQYLTSVLRGESKGQEVVVEGVGDGCSEARLIEKGPSEKDKLKAAELLGRRWGIYSDNVNVAVEPVTITDDIEE